MIRRVFHAIVLVGVLCSVVCGVPQNTLLAQIAGSDESDDTSVTSNESEKTDESEKSSEVAETSKSIEDTVVETRVLRTALPTLTPDGRPIRAVEVFLSQLAELVPRNFLPISIDKLADAAAEAIAEKSPAESAQIRNAHYVIQLRNDTLVSDRSNIDIQYDGKTVIEQPLGKVNFAIDPLPTRSIVTNDSLPRLESHSDGSLSAFVDGDATISFVWSLKGTLRGLSREFDLRIPPAPQTLIELSTPRGVILDVLDGVIRQLPAPPVGASFSEAESDVQWWRIDAGGLDLVRLRVRTIDETLESESIIVRRSSYQYEIDPSGVNWTCRMTVQFPSRETYPPLLVDGGNVVSVSVDSVDIPFTTLVRTEKSQIIQMQSGDSVAPRPGMTTTVNVTGFCSWESDTGWCDLPAPNWLSSRVLQTAATAQTVLRIADSLRMVAWQLPDKWTRSQATSADAVSLYQAEGPPFTPPSLPMFDDLPSSDVESNDRIATTQSPPWSRVRLASHEPLSTFESMFAFAISDGALDAKARFVIKTAQNRMEPIDFKLEDNWKLLTLSLPVSGRLLESWDYDPNTNFVTLWPESNEVANGEIVVEATGRTRLQTDKSLVSIPSSWFLRLSGVRGTMLAAMIPPGTLNWSGDTSMRISRIAPDALTPTESAFLASLSPEALLFRTDKMSTPTFTMMPPSVSFNMASVLEIHREAEEWVETLELETDATNPLLTSLNVETGASHGRPPYRWLLKSNAESEPVSLPATSIRFDESDETGTYRIDLSKRELGGKTLIGRRRYRELQQLELQLPQVPEASSQNAEVLIGKGLEVRDRSESVLRVPITSGSAKERLRYDPVDQPSVVIASTKFEPNVNLVWQKQVRVAASSRGTDSIELSMNVSATDPIQVKYSPELHLTGVYRGETRVTDLQRTPSSVTIQPNDGGNNLRILWTRNNSFRGWWRRCRIPKIDVSGIVISERSTLVASSDSFVLATLLFGVTDAKSGTMICDVVPESRKLIMHHNIAIGLGWLFAVMTFAICWWVANRSATVVAAIVTLAVTMAFLWSTWAIAVIGWFILPASAAVLLSTSIHFRRSPSEADENGNTIASSPSIVFGGRSRSEDGFSFVGPESNALWWLVVVLVAWSQSPVTAQSPATTAPPSRPSPTTTNGAVAENSLARSTEAITAKNAGPVIMIVPVDVRGAIAGDKVYVPDSLHANLFKTQINEQAVPVRFQFADYRVKIEPTRNLSAVTPPSVYAEYVARVDRPSNQIVLPLQGKNVRRVELVGPDDDRIVRFTSFNESSIVVNVPPASLYRLRVTLIPSISVTGGSTQVDLEVPPINSARLTVDLDRSLENILVEGAAGLVVADSDLRRTVAHLGPASRIVLRYVNRDRVEPVAAQSLVRRYWVQCGQNQTTVDCEVTPSTPIRNGQSLSLIVFDSAMPTLASPTWRIVVNEMLSPMRRQLTLMSLADTPTPIRLIWTVPSQINDPNTVEDQVEMAIPEVSLLTSGPAVPIWVAIQHDPRLRVNVSNKTPFALLPPDQFLSGWIGYRDRIDQSVVTTVRAPSLALTQIDESKTTVVSRQQLQVSTNDLSLRYSATLNSNDAKSAPRILKVPQGFDVLSVSINGVPINSASIQSENGQEVLLEPLPASNPVEIDVMAKTSVPKDGRFTPQRFELWPPVDSQETYMLLRDATTLVKTITQPLLAGTNEPNGKNVSGVTVAPSLGPAASRVSDAELLAAGWIPMITWKLDQTKNSGPVDLLQPPGMTMGELPGGVFEVSSQLNRFSTNQLIMLAWQDGRWSMETHIEISNGKVPDFIDVEVPTRWCEALEVSPERTWSRQPSTNPLLQVIRIRCDASLRTDRVTVRGQLKTSDKGRISVPTVSVLGSGRRSVFVSVPDRLTNDTIFWRPNAVTKGELPDSWKQMLPGTTTERSTYNVAGPGWSVELAALPVATATAQVTGAETQVYFSNAFALVLARWDLVPGGVTSVGVELPADADVVAAWAATQPIHTTLVKQQNGDATTQANVFSQDRIAVRVPLALDRLSQSIEVLYRVPTPRASNVDYVATLTNLSPKESITQRDSWVSVYRLAPSNRVVLASTEATTSSTDSANSLDTLAYALAQATSVVESVERTEDNLAERPADEIVSWLVPWINRYEALSRMAGRKVDFESLIASATLDSKTDTHPVAESNRTMQPLADARGIDLLANASEQVAQRIVETRWKDLDRRIGEFVDQFLREQPVSQAERDRLSSRFGAMGFDGYERIELSRVASGESPPSLVWQVDTAADPLRQFIANCLTVLLVLALLVMSWRFKTSILHIVHHPAIWLAVLAVCCVYVAPLPVAVSLFLLAVVLPLMPQPKKAENS